MPPALIVRRDLSPEALAGMAEAARDPGYAARLRAIAAILSGASRGEAATIGGMERQTLRDWVSRYNQDGPEGLYRKKPTGRPAKLTLHQKQMLAAIIMAGPRRELGQEAGRWRLADLVEIIRQRFDVDLDEVSVGRVLRSLGFRYNGNEWKREGNYSLQAAE